MFAADGEQWKPVRGHPGYEASSLGRVRSVPRVLRDGREAGGTVLKPQRDKDGYQTVKLGRKRMFVHRCVALAFHGPPEVRHLDGNQENCRPENLAWGSRLENEEDKWEQWNGSEREGERGRGDGGYRPFQAETDAGTRLIRLSEAVSQGVVSRSLASVRKASGRDPTFPPSRGMDGLARLYAAEDLRRWDGQTSGLPR